MAKAKEIPWEKFMQEVKKEIEREGNAKVSIAIKEGRGPQGGYKAVKRTYRLQGNPEIFTEEEINHDTEDSYGKILEEAETDLLKSLPSGYTFNAQREVVSTIESGKLEKELTKQIKLF